MHSNSSKTKTQKLFSLFDAYGCIAMNADRNVCANSFARYTRSQFEQINNEQRKKTKLLHFLLSLCVHDAIRKYPKVPVMALILY